MLSQLLLQLPLLLLLLNKMERNIHPGSPVSGKHCTKEVYEVKTTQQVYLAASCPCHMQKTKDFLMQKTKETSDVVLQGHV